MTIIGRGAILFMGSSVKFDTFTRLSWAEYVFVSLSLALGIAEPDSLQSNQPGTSKPHWGTAVVSNIFVYGLLFAGARATAIFFQALYLVGIVDL